jgi:hypothetical protein
MKNVYLTSSIHNMDANCLVFCIFQPDHVPDPWMNTVCFASSNATMLPTVDENCLFFFIQPDHLGRPPQQLQQPLARSLARFLLSFLGGAKRWGFGKGDSGTGIRESRRSERLMLLVGLFLFFLRNC